MKNRLLAAFLLGTATLTLGPVACNMASDEAAAPAAGTELGIQPAWMDTSVKPGDDFNRYANGKWIDRTEIPANVLDHRFRDIGLGCIPRETQYFDCGMLGMQLGHEPLQILRSPTHKAQIGSFLRKRSRCRRADSPASANNQHHFSQKS